MLQKYQRPVLLIHTYVSICSIIEGNFLFEKAIWTHSIIDNNNKKKKPFQCVFVNKTILVKNLVMQVNQKEIQNQIYNF